MQPPASIFLGLFCRHKSLRAPVEIELDDVGVLSTICDTQFITRLRFGHHCSLFSCSFQNSLRYCFKAACRDESLRAANVAEIVDVKQTEKIVPIITCEVPSVSMSANWYSVSMYLIWILGSKLILSTSQSCANLWVRETCLIIGLLPLMIRLWSSGTRTTECTKERPSFHPSLGIWLLGARHC